MPARCSRAHLEPRHRLDSRLHPAPTQPALHKCAINRSPHRISPLAIDSLRRLPLIIMSESPHWSNPLRDSRDLRLPRIAGPCSLVIFGVTGDLAQKKLLPAVYDLANRGLLPPSFGLTGFARRDWTQERFIEFVKTAVQAHCAPRSKNRPGAIWPPASVLCRARSTTPRLLSV